MRYFPLYDRLSLSYAVVGAAQFNGGVSAMPPHRLVLSTACAFGHGGYTALRYPKTMSLRSWVESDLWDENYFDPSRLSQGVEVFRSGLSFPLVTSLIDGCHGTPEWGREAQETNTAALFRALRGLVRRYGASWIYITDPDNALSVFQWEEEINPDHFNSYRLIEFERNPAEEGGASFLCIAFHDREGIVVIECGTSLKITLHGTPARMDAMLESLGVRGSTEDTEGITSRG